MKSLTLISLGFFSFLALATEGEQFEKMKAMKLANIDKRIALIQELKTCVGAAINKDNFKSCHDKHNTDMKSLHEGNKSIKEQLKNEKEMAKKKS